MFITILAFDLAIIAGIWLFLKYRKSNKHQKQCMDDFVQKENAANFARRKDIEPEMYYTPDLTRLPFKEYEQTEQNVNIIRRVKDVREKSSKRMMRFDEEISNTDLKIRYGATNLDFIAGCEENYRKFINALNEWGQTLFNVGMYEDAIIVMEESIRMGSDMSRSFKLLADLYKEVGETQKLNNLLADIESQKYKFSSELITETVIQYLKKPEV